MPAEHYFSSNPQSKHHAYEFTMTVRGLELRLVTDAGVFAASKLDRGTRLLVEALAVPPEAQKLVDLGCGYGPIGLALASMAPKAQVFMVDTNERACGLAKANAARNRLDNVTVLQGDGLSAVPGELDLVATNPPIRAGKKVVYGLVAEAAHRLKPGGELWAVIRTNQGARSLEAELGRVFGAVAEVEKGGGFRVYRATRRP